MACKGITFAGASSASYHIYIHIYIFLCFWNYAAFITYLWLKSIYFIYICDIGGRPHNWLIIRKWYVLSKMQTINGWPLEHNSLRISMCDIRFLLYGKWVDNKKLCIFYYSNEHGNSFIYFNLFLIPISINFKKFFVQATVRNRKIFSNAFHPDVELLA